MKRTLTVKTVDIIELEPKDGFLKEGLVSIYLEEWNLDLKNIPYHIDKNNKIHVRVDGIYLDRKQKNGPVKGVFIPHFHFRDEVLWDKISLGIQRMVLKHIGKKS